MGQIFSIPVEARAARALDQFLRMSLHLRILSAKLEKYNWRRTKFLDIRNVAILGNLGAEMQFKHRRKSHLRLTIVEHKAGKEGQNVFDIGLTDYSRPNHANKYSQQFVHFPNILTAIRDALMKKPWEET